MVDRARSATAEQIQYWSQTLDELGSLEASSEDWLERTCSKWMAQKLVDQWKVVAQKYSECAHTVCTSFTLDLA